MLTTALICLDWLLLTSDHQRATITATIALCLLWSQPTMDGQIINVYLWLQSAAALVLGLLRYLSATRCLQLYNVVSLSLISTQTVQQVICFPFKHYCVFVLLLSKQLLYLHSFLTHSEG